MLKGKGSSAVECWHDVVDTYSQMSQDYWRMVDINDHDTGGINYNITKERLIVNRTKDDQANFASLFKISTWTISPYSLSSSDKPSAHEDSACNTSIHSVILVRIRNHITLDNGKVGLQTIIARSVI